MNKPVSKIPQMSPTSIIHSINHWKSSAIRSNNRPTSYHSLTLFGGYRVQSIRKCGNNFWHNMSVLYYKDTPRAVRWRAGVRGYSWWVWPVDYDQVAVQAPTVSRAQCSPLAWHYKRWRGNLTRISSLSRTSPSSKMVSHNILTSLRYCVQNLSTKSWLCFWRVRPFFFFFRERKPENNYPTVELAVGLSAIMGRPFYSLMYVMTTEINTVICCPYALYLKYETMGDIWTLGGSRLAR